MSIYRQYVKLFVKFQMREPIMSKAQPMIMMSYLPKVSNPKEHRTCPNYLIDFLTRALHVRNKRL